MGSYIYSLDPTSAGLELIFLTKSGSTLGLNQDALLSKINICVTTVNNTTTADSNLLITLSKSDAPSYTNSGSTLALDYDNLVTKLNTYHTTSAYNSSISNYYNNSEIDSKLIPYVITLSNTTVDANSYILLSKVIIFVHYIIKI